MESIARWIQDDGICFSSTSTEVSSKVFDLRIHELDIMDIIREGIFLTISARICDELD